ncbi:MAG: helicase C-terminal domain-containing protein [Candidatus Heimdallarchaeota archaeon]
MSGSSRESYGLSPALQLFPHKELRKYQTQFLRFVERHPRVMIHAPVGFGKTIMALISALPLVRDKNFQLYIFVRTKAQVFDVFLKQIFKIANSRKYGYLTAVPLILKADLCLKRDQIPVFYRGVCGRIRCPLLEQTQSIPAEDFPAIVEQIPITGHTNDTTPISAETFKEAFREFGCPYYVIQQSIPHANIVVTTHTYLRSKNLQELFAPLLNRGPFTSKIAIIDEAHNFTADVEAELTKYEVEKTKKIISLKTLDTLLSLIEGQRGRIERPRSLNPALLDAYLETERELSLAERLEVLKIQEFLSARGDVWISEEDRLVQLNPFPTHVFRFINQHFQRVILMSGTLTPLAAYQTLYGTEYPSLSIPSNFQFALNGLLYLKNFTSKFAERGPHTYKAMAQVIERLHEGNPFHTVVFAPSHDFKEKILAQIGVPDVYVETPGSHPYFITELQTKRHALVLGVLGGKLSEGIEVLHPESKRSLLTLICIAGMAFPRPNATTLLLQDLYRKRWGHRVAKHLGLLPVTQGIAQAIGRGIRSESDFAASLILDYRAARYRSLLPSMRVFRDLTSLYAAYDLFFVRMRKMFQLPLHELKSNHELPPNW